MKKRELTPYPFVYLNKLLSNITPKKELVDLSIGEPKFNLPKFIQEGIEESLGDFVKYPSTSGTKELIEAQTIYIKNRFGIENENLAVLPTLGSREGLYSSITTLIREYAAKNIAIPNPFYKIYEGSAVISNIENIQYIDLKEENNFEMIIDEKVAKEIDILIINYPNNPTAAMASMKYLKNLVTLSLKYDFKIISDECYIDIYTDEIPKSILEASIEVGNDNFKNIIALNSLSKRVSSPGIRSGYIAGDKSIIDKILQYKTYMGSAIPIPLQHASSKGWLDTKYNEIYRKKYMENIEVARRLLGTNVSSTFYLYINTKNSEEFTKTLYKEEGIKVVPAKYMSNSASNEYIRIALVYEKDVIESALERIKSYL